MSDIAISIQDLSKEYRLGVISTGTLSHDLNRWWARVRGKEDPNLKIGTVNKLSEAGGEYVWALRDINLEVKKGEVLGIIGKNGAGKSTLLKILSRVTTPTTGTVKMNGRVASLLEVGTGFHPELTGRENIFLNGAILGMTKWEIKKEFDEIVAFSGVEKYIDTPVKRYSSGMYVRLAFAVAAHLESEILVVDEVLAVGDAEFQKKALGKMQEVSRGEERTVLFVSHNMGAVRSLCSNGAVLENGSVKFYSQNINDAVDKYLNSNFKIDYAPIAQRNDREGNKKVSIEGLMIPQLTGEGYFQNDKEFQIKLRYRSNDVIMHPKVYVSVNDENEQAILFLDSSAYLVPNSLKKEGEVTISIADSFALGAGRYFLNVAFFTNNDLADYVKYALVFNVVDGAFYPNGRLPSSRSVCHVKQNWEFES